ncbi:MAG: DUF790 family protein [bacterium]|nr:DUF790 family protein [bacterium]
MLTSDLLITRRRGPYLEPRYIDPTAPSIIDLAADIIHIFSAHQGQTRRDLHTALDTRAGDATDYRVQRGLAKLLADDRCEFRIHSAVEPVELRERIFSLARENHPIVREPDVIYPVTRDHILDQVALEHHTSTEEIANSLYADLSDNHILDHFDTPDPAWILHRYNVALAQAMFYRCARMRISVHRNLPVRYKQLFKFIKFFRLIHDIRGDRDAGYEIVLDGPVSMFRLSQKYGLQMSVFLPALLLCTRWKMEAEIALKDGSTGTFVLDEHHNLISHYKDQAVYDSLLEETFAARFEKAKTDWQLERETELINLKDTVFIPDFAFSHPDGRTALLEIVGFWHPDYLRRKLDKLRRAARKDLVVAVSRDLNVQEDDFKNIPGHVFFFKNRIQPKDVIERLNTIRPEDCVRD